MKTDTLQAWNLTDAYLLSMDRNQLPAMAHFVAFCKRYACVPSVGTVFAAWQNIIARSIFTEQDIKACLYI